MRHMITQTQYESALKLIDAFRLQENSKLLTKPTFNWDEFCKFYSIKSGTPRVDDIVIISKRGFDGGNPKEDHLFEVATVTGYCLPDEFYAVNEEGQERFFLDTSYFKIISHADNVIAA